MREAAEPMALPVQVVFRKMSHSSWLEDVIRQRAAKLEKFCPYITDCRVVVDIPHKHHRRGNVFHMQIHVLVPGKEIVVNTEAVEDANFKEISCVLKDAFDAVRRQLADYVRLRRGDVKTHLEKPLARVRQVFPDSGYGFLETPDGREIYFHSNSLIGSTIKDLAVGTSVTFVEVQTDNGAQASSVRVE